MKLIVLKNNVLLLKIGKCSYCAMLWLFLFAVVSDGVFFWFCVYIFVDRYMDATLHASVELQQSMNVLFQFQQKTQKLDESKSQIQTTKDDLRAAKARLIEKEKERRVFKQHTCEIQELTKILGESSEDLVQMKIDAKYANTVMVELNACKLKNKSLKDEIIRLRKLHGKDSHHGLVHQESDDQYSGMQCDGVYVSYACM